ncbi:hypothetical protein N0V88_004332 [Collariella sp. IMI 366227]|nr:hypothetical protein N0V88_004332 [Collariella sp. IMI 366227]
MKIIVTGCTGLVGSALVRQCIASDTISHILALSRKSLPDDIAKHAKVTTILHADFSTYPLELLAQLAGAEDTETYRKVQVDYTLAAARAFLENLAPGLPEGKPFRFVFCSGKFAEWDQQKALHFMADTRRGQVEKGLCDIADEDQASQRFVVYCARPSGILPADAGFAARMTGKLYGSIDANRLARALIRILVEGDKERIVENDRLLSL